jgi:hypothetical protein
VRDFDGTDDELSIDADEALYKITGIGGEVSLFCWCESDLASSDQLLFGKWSSLVAGRSYRLGINATNSYVMQVYDGVSLATAISTTARSSALHAIGGSFSPTAGGNYVRVYVNGAQEHSIAALASIQDTTSHLQIGETHTDSNDFDGRIGGCAIWGAALNDDEHKALYHGVSPLTIRRGALLGWWPLLGGSPEPDLSGHFNMVVVAGTTLAAYKIPMGPYVLSFPPRSLMPIVAAAGVTSATGNDLDATATIDPGTGSVAGATTYATGSDLAATATIAPGTVAVYDITAIVPFQPPVATPQRPALANYELWNPARTSRIAFVSPWEVLAGQVRFSSEAAGADTLRLEMHREAAYVMDGARRRELSGLGRALALYDNPVLVRRSADTFDSAFRLATSEDVPHGYGDVVHRTEWKSLLYETQEEEIGADRSYINVLAHVALAEIVTRSGIVAAGDVAPALDRTLARFILLRDSTVWDALWKLADTLGCLLQPRLQTVANAWTGKLRVSLVPYPTTTTHILAPAFNLTPGASRQLLTTDAFSRVRPYLADGSDISRARFAVREVVGSEIRTMPGDVLGPAENTWQGKTLAVFNGVGPSATKLWSATISSDRPDGERHILVMASAPPGSVTFGTYFGFFEDAAASEPVLYVRHKPLEDAIGVRQRVERLSIPNEVVENVHAFLGESYDGNGVPLGGYAKEGAATTSKNTLAELDLDDDGDLEPLSLLGGGSWKATTSTIATGQKITLDLIDRLEYLKLPLFVRVMHAVKSGQVRVRAEDSGERAITAGQFPQLFTDATPIVGNTATNKAYFANIGNFDMPFEEAKVRFWIKSKGGAPTTQYRADYKIGLVDETGTYIADIFSTTNGLLFYRDGGYYYAETAFEGDPTRLPAAYNLAFHVWRIVLMPGGTQQNDSSVIIDSVGIDSVTLRHVTPNVREIVSRVGERKYLDYRIGPWRPIGDVTLKLIAHAGVATEWYTDLIQTKRAESLTDINSPLADTGASEAIRQVAGLWAQEESGGERYSFTFAALDRHYAEPDAFPRALEIDQLARIVVSELDLDEKFPIVELTIDDFSLGNVLASVGRKPTRLSSLSARYQVRTRDELSLLADKLGRLEISVTTA